MTHLVVCRAFSTNNVQSLVVKSIVQVTFPAKFPRVFDSLGFVYEVVEKYFYLTEL